MNIFISCIGRRGYLARFFREAAGPECCILATSNSEWTPGFKDCDQTFLLPDIRSDEYVDRVHEFCVSRNVDLMLSALDVDIHRLSAHRDRFEKSGIATFISSESVSRVCFDKLETVRFLESHGMAQGQTFGSCEEAGIAINDGRLEFPVFVKPRFGFGSTNLFVARNVNEMQTFAAYQNDMMIQEKLPGEEYSFDILNNLQGEVVNVVVKKKLLMRSGETDQAITVLDDDLTQFAVNLGRTLRHIGPLDVDLFWDGKTARILELNPRFGGGYPISHIAGADFPGLMLRMARGESPELRTNSYRPDVRMMKEIGVFECSDLVSRVTDLRG